MIVQRRKVIAVNKVRKVINSEENKMPITQTNHRFFVNAKWMLIALVMILALGMTVFSRKSFAGVSAEMVPSQTQESVAFKQYTKQPKTEMAKINFLFNRLNKSPMKVLYDGHEYEMPEAMKIAKSYLFKHYKKESAEHWIKNYCYKTDNGNVILFKLSDGQKVPVREVALQELNALEKIA